MTGLIVGVQQVAVRKMLDDVSPRITPVVKDLAPEDVATNPCMVVVTGIRQMIMACHDRIHIFDFECRMVEAGFTNSNTQQAVVIRLLIAPVTAQEGGDHILGLTEIDLVGG